MRSTSSWRRLTPSRCSTAASRSPKARRRRSAPTPPCSRRTSVMAEALLRVSGLRVSYGAREILRGVDFALAEGEAVALLGPNGSGKSTCLNAISGFAPIGGGDLVFAGAHISGWPVHRVVRHGVVQVSQSRDLFPDLSVEDNLQLGAYIRDAADPAEVFELFPRLAER